MKKISRFLIVIWMAAVLLLFIYSYTQIDLNLTLFKFKFYQLLQEKLIYIGYFKRPLSSIMFTILVLLFTGIYFYLLKAKISKKLLKILIAVSIILIFAYPAFSHDIFNYIFDARILVHYQDNPYHSHAWDYPQDTWIRFMHWIHRPFPYGPVWLAASSLFYLIGLGKFSLTLFSFKILSYLTYIGSGYFLWKINRKKSISLAKKSAIYFLFNPVIIFELLISGHNDGLMMVLMLAAIFLVINKKIVSGALAFLLSVGVKFTSLIYAPVLLPLSNEKVRKKFWHLLVNTLIVLSLISVAYLIQRRELQPWYLIWPLSLAALTPQSFLSKGLSVFSIGAVLSYIPFLYYGNWDPPVPGLKLNILYTSFVLTLIIVGVQFILKRYGTIKK